MLLGGHAAWHCPVVVQNDFNRLIPKEPWEPSPEDAARQQAGRDFEAEVFALLKALHPEASVIDPSLRRTAAIDATVAAMDAEATLILGGWLPDDIDGGRTGRPDILLRVPGGYLPADVKNHKTLKPAKRITAEISRLEAPAERFELQGSSSESKKRFRDGMQLAHYTRMLQACGRHPGPLVGAILGSDRIELDGGPELLFTWHTLDIPLYDTFSRTDGKKKRSLLECYDFEHQFRVRVAQNAQRILGTDDDPPLMVRPIGQKECGKCRYQELCADQMGPDDASATIITGRLDVREWRSLHRLGVETTAELAAVDADDAEFFDDYYSEVSNRGRDEARRRLAEVIRRAGLITAGTEIIRDGDSAVAVPTADIEIDFDIESDPAGRVYMWGVRVRNGTDDSTADYRKDFLVWDLLDSPAEHGLASRFVAWLRGVVDDATAAGKTVAIFHWTDYEITKLKSILGLAEVGDLIDPQRGLFVDLHKFFKANFFSAHGASLKTVAPQFGFTWRVDDPGGGISQVYLNTVQNSSDPIEVAAAKEWLLSYNEGDTAATAVIRDGMRTWDGEGERFSDDSARDGIVRSLGGNTLAEEPGAGASVRRTNRVRDMLRGEIATSRFSSGVPSSRSKLKYADERRSWWHRAITRSAI